MYCGVPGKCNSLGGNVVPADASDEHAVRCCSDDPSSGWNMKCNKASGITGVYGQSPECRTLNFADAREFCETFPGGRLCSPLEMAGRCTGNTGCGFNKKLVWGCVAMAMCLTRMMRQRAAQDTATSSTSAQR